MEIENYPGLEKIVFKKGSLMNLNSLKICNCEKLNIIEIEDGEIWKDDNGSPCVNSPLFTVKNLIIESIWLSYLIWYVYIFLIYNHSKQEIFHSLKQEVYLYQVILSNSILVYIFLN